MLVSNYRLIIGSLGVKGMGHLPCYKAGFGGLPILDSDICGSYFTLVALGSWIPYLAPTILSLDDSPLMGRPPHNTNSIPGRSCLRAVHSELLSRGRRRP